MFCSDFGTFGQELLQDTKRMILPCVLDLALVNIFVGTRKCHFDFGDDMLAGQDNAQLDNVTWRCFAILVNVRLRLVMWHSAFALI